MWGFSTILHFGATDPNWPAFLLYLRTAFFEAHLLSSLKILQLWIPKSYKLFMEPSYTIVIPYSSILLQLVKEEEVEISKKR